MKFRYLALALTLVTSAALAQTVYVAPTKVNVVDYGAICDNDPAHAAINSGAIQAAIDALNPFLGGIVEFPGNGSQCQYTDPVPTWNGKLHIGFRGSSVKGTAPGSGTTLFYLGTGPRMLDLRESGGFLLDGITMWAENSAFSGAIIDGGSTKPIGSRTAVTSYIKIVNSNLIGTPTSTCLNVDFTLMTEISSSTIAGCGTGIRAAWLGPSGSEPYGDVNVSLTTSDTLFFGIHGDAVKGCGSSWTFGKGTVFEQQWGTGRAAGHTTSAAQPCEAVNYTGAWFGDVTDTTNDWLNLYCRGANIQGNRFGNVGITLPNCNGYVIQGNAFDGVRSVTCSVSSTSGLIGPSYYGTTPQPTSPCPPPTSSPLPTGWTPFTGPLASQGGPFATASWVGEYQVTQTQSGKTVALQGTAYIDAPGSASGWVEVALPIPAAGPPSTLRQFGGYYEGGTSSQSGACITIPGFPGANPGRLLCRKADGSSPIPPVAVPPNPQAKAAMTIGIVYKAN